MAGRCAIKPFNAQKHSGA